MVRICSGSRCELLEDNLGKNSDWEKVVTSGNMGEGGKRISKLGPPHQREDGNCKNNKRNMEGTVTSGIQWSEKEAGHWRSII